MVEKNRGLTIWTSAVGALASTSAVPTRSTDEPNERPAVGMSYDVATS
jgi:hypothetical protein